MSFLSQPLSLSTFFPNNRQIADIQVQVVINESTTDTLTITKQPIQQGASITDHAFLEPTQFTMTIYFTDNSFLSRFSSVSSFLNSGAGLSKIYKQLLTLQSSRAPFPVKTPKRTYNNMLISSLGMTTDKNTENCLAITISFQQVIIVNVATVQAPPASQTNAGLTQATQAAGNKSVLLSLTQAAAGLRGGTQ